MPLSDIVHITITRTSGGVSKTGFGTMLLLQGGTQFDEGEYVRSYSSLTAVLDDFNSKSPQYCAASAAFSAEVKPQRIKIGLLPLTELNLLLPSDYDADDYEEFSVEFPAESLEATYLADPGDDPDDIMAGLAAAIVALGVGCPYTATSALNVLTITIKPGASVTKITADWSNGLLYFTFYDTDDLAAGMAELRKDDDDWYMSMWLSRVVDEQKAYAAYVETIRKQYNCASNDPRIKGKSVGDVGTMVNIAAYLQSKNYARSAASFHTQATYLSNTLLKDYDIETPELITGINSYTPTGVTIADATELADYIADPSNDEWLDVAWVASRIWVDPDTETATWMFAKDLPGVTADTFTDTEWSAVKALNCNLYNEVGGHDIMESGTVGEGEYIDIILGLDWLYARTQERVYGVYLANLKVPYTDSGIGMLAGAVGSVMQWGQRTQFLMNDQGKGPMGYRLTATPRILQDASDIADRLVKGIDANGTPAGAVHAVDVSIEIEG